MPTLTKNQKFQLSEMNATFHTIARWVSKVDEKTGARLPAEQVTTVTVIDATTKANIAEASSDDEQAAIDAAIEAARVAKGAAPMFVDEETRLKAKVDEQAKQLAELSGMVKQMLTAQTPPAKTEPKTK
jgi:hypothetical protein